MSVLIKGMEMPCACVFCVLYDGDLYWCKGARKEVPYNPEDKRAKFCPLVPVPPHGRLIDADALIVEINDRIEAAIKWGVNAIADRNGEIKLRAEQAVATFCEASLTAKKLPTIIEAEEERDMSYFPTDIPFMSDNELIKNGLKPRKKPEKGEAQE